MHCTALPPRLPLPRLRALVLSLCLAGVVTPLALLPGTTIAATDIETPAILLARNYHAKINPAAYLVSEKLDGVRAIWDGKQLRFRSGRLIQAPAWFTAALPAHPLDGELWMGRRRFEAVSAAVRRQLPDDAEWQQISYQIYELPQGQGSFSDRLVTLRHSIAENPARWLQILPQQRVSDHTELQALLRKMTSAGAEGLMLHQADAPWQTGRSDVLLKLKLHQDAEAVVIGHEPGRGKYQGLLGALLVQTPEGQRFRLGSGLSDAQRQSPPAIGSTVTYRYRDLSANGIPKFASFLRIRESE